MKKTGIIETLFLIVPLLLVFDMVENAQAGTMLPDRVTLNSLLGGTALTEDFEKFNVAPGSQAFFPSLVLNSSTIDPLIGGPGLVRPEVTFALISGEMRAHGAGLISPTKSLGYHSNDPPAPSILRIDFQTPVTALGFDFFGGFFGGELIKIIVLGSDDTTVLEQDGFALPAPTAAAVFLGIEDLAGIGSIVLENAVAFSSVDNLTFGQVIPEPSTWLLLGTGLLGFALVRKKLPA
jgi:hypothetical protein